MCMYILVMSTRAEVRHANVLFFGTVMTSCYYASTPTRGSWFQTNQPEHESDDRAGDTVTSVCVLPMRKIRHCSGKFDQHLSLYHDAVKPKLQTGPGYWFFVRVLWDMISKIYWQFWHSFIQNALESNCNSNPIEITWGKWYVQFVWNQCRWQRDVCIHYDVSLCQRIRSLIGGGFYGDGG